jgi:TusA-related sulfurtransferase/ketosteroid isomerase-like protein
MIGLAPPPASGTPPAAVDNLASELGRAFVDAIVDGDFDRLEALMTPDVRFRALTPREHHEAATATGARAIVEDWFDETDPRELLGLRVEPVGDKLAIGYRLELTAHGERRVVEQHVAAVVEGRALRDLSLVCTGFRPITAADSGRPEAPSFEPAARLDGIGLSCATLTPTIRSAVNELDFGAVLEILTDDPTAEEGLRSWTRLTGNELVAAEPGPGTARRFAIRRTPRDAASITRKGTR